MWIYTKGTWAYMGIHKVYMGIRNMGMHKIYISIHGYTQTIHEYTLVCMGIIGIHEYMGIHKVYMHIHGYTWMYVGIHGKMSIHMHGYTWVYTRYTWVLGVSCGGVSSWLLPFCGSGGLLNSDTIFTHQALIFLNEGNGLKSIPRPCLKNDH